MAQFRNTMKCLAFATAAIAAPGLANAAPDITGVWLNDTGRGAIEIKSCGDQVCGHVVWVKDAGDTKGCGRQIIGDASEVKPGLWDNGWIYSPEKKAKYDVELKPLSDGTLRVVGYAGTKLFSKTMIWTRAPANLQRCGTQEASKQSVPEPAPAAAPAAAVTAPVHASAASAKTETPPDPAPAKTAEISPPLPPVKSDLPVAEAKTEVPPPPKPEAATPEKAPKPTRKAEAPRQDADEDADEPAPAKDRILKKLNLDKVFKRTASGDCKLDLPWVKVRFKCGNEE